MKLHSMNFFCENGYPRCQIEVSDVGTYSIMFRLGCVNIYLNSMASLIEFGDSINKAIKLTMLEGEEFKDA